MIDIYAMESMLSDRRERSCVRNNGKVGRNFSQRGRKESLESTLCAQKFVNNGPKMGGGGGGGHKTKNREDLF